MKKLMTGLSLFAALAQGSAALGAGSIFPDRNDPKRVMSLNEIVTVQPTNDAAIDVLAETFLKRASDVTSLDDVGSDLMTGVCFSSLAADPSIAGFKVASEHRDDGPLALPIQPKVLLVDNAYDNRPLQSTDSVAYAYRHFGAPFLDSAPSLARMDDGSWKISGVDSSSRTLSFVNGGRADAKTTQHFVRKVKGTPTPEFVVLRKESSGVSSAMSICYFSQARAAAPAKVAGARPLQGREQGAAMWVGQQYFFQLQAAYRQAGAVTSVNDVKALPSHGFCVAREISARSLSDRFVDKMSFGELVDRIEAKAASPAWQWTVEVQPFNTGVVDQTVRYGKMLSSEGAKILAQPCDRYCMGGDMQARLGLGDKFERTTNPRPLVDEISQTLALVENQQVLGPKLVMLRRANINGQPVLMMRSLRKTLDSVEEELCYSSTNALGDEWLRTMKTIHKQPTP